MSKLASPIAVVTGVGPGTGSALVRRFAAGGYRVAMLARDERRLKDLQAEIPNAASFPCDVADPVALETTLTQIDRSLGTPKVVVHNAVGGAFGGFTEIDPGILRTNFETNVMALLHLARHVVPPMAAADGGSLIVTGNTSALRGRQRFAGFAPTKAAQRILAESIAREMGPKGVHVAYLVIDAVIDVPWARERYKDAADDFFIKPSAIAEEVWHVAHQDRSAWSFLTEVRPYRETW
ncbi:SDR family NAD(P)-dependent oxidoreductase [Bradyrhizobium sp. CCBAU 53338]|uniref:SDR family NAD(P)-dependent oxidoreductase n=1 Tax=Bradyrhizobium sp. CCBAU 53338 TaxID=1325111 RepID=UPI001FEE888B|nr:SDR family NAD(P)-dependent oxidoreductase [Bradyrhizobium sp. CCBAU 53338]